MCLRLALPWHGGAYGSAFVLYGWIARVAKELVNVYRYSISADVDRYLIGSRLVSWPIRVLCNGEISRAESP